MLKFLPGNRKYSTVAVSYTHLDVYKRQVLDKFNLNYCVRVALLIYNCCSCPIKFILLNYLIVYVINSLSKEKFMFMNLFKTILCQCFEL